MAGLRRTGRILVLALIPWVVTGCAATNSRLAKLSSPSTQEQEQTWAQAQIHEKEGRYAEAQQLYAELCRRDPKSAQYAHRLGVAATMTGDHARASAAYSKARELDPQNAELLADMGYAAYLQQHYVEAEGLLRASLAEAEDNPRALSNLALVVGFQGRYDESRALFRQVHGQDEVEVLCNLAYVKSQRGDSADAMALYQQALAIDPQLKKATVALAALKSAETKSQAIAQQKPYRKYMNENTPAVAKAPVEASTVATANAELDSEAGRADFLLTSQNDEQDAQELDADDDQSLTGWTESETDPAPSAQVTTREFPDENVSTSQAPEKRAAAEAANVQSVSTDEAPFAVAEEPDASESTTATSEIPEALARAIDDPAAEDNGWAAASSAEDATFGPEWLAGRMEQIAARHGQSGFMSFCPVALRDEQKLVDALPQHTAEHQSQTYQFSSEAAVRKFQADPERYLASAGGLDVVAVSQGTAVAQGSLEHALWFRHKLYLFVNSENLEVFRTQARQFAVQQ